MNSNSQIVETLSAINDSIKFEQNISLEDLKILLLITYNECLMQENPDPLIKSFLTVTLNNFIELEDYYSSQLLTQDNNYSEEQIMNFVTHRKTQD